MSSSKYDLGKDLQDIARIKRRLLRFLAGLPGKIKQNPEWQGETGRSFGTVKLTVLKKHGYWDPEYYDFRRQAAVLIQYVSGTSRHITIHDIDKNTVKEILSGQVSSHDAIVNRLNEVLHKGIIPGKAYGSYYLKLHPDFLAVLRRLIYPSRNKPSALGRASLKTVQDE